jgi:hypothetical protein
MSPVRYELDFYIPDDGNFHSHGSENLIRYTASCLVNWLLIMLSVTSLSVTYRFVQK